jgi:phosphoribosylanthranilate isomerase
MPRTRIKICGVRDPQTALIAIEHGADAIGLVFAEASPRYVDPEAAWEIISYLPPFITSVGLFVDPTADHFITVREACPFEIGQLHGNETTDHASTLGPGIIKAIRFDPATIAEDLRRWSAVDELSAILVDGSAGGEGTTFDWAALAEAAPHCDHPLILAGGLTPSNVADAIRAVRPFAVDVSSGVESSRGVKDPDLIRAFCQAVMDADRD